MSAFLDTQIKFLKKTDLRSKKILLLVVSLLSLVFLVIANIVLAPQAPSFPFFLSSKTDIDIAKAIKWHMAHNPSEVLPEEHFCSVKQNQDKNGLSFTFHCPSASLSFTKKIDRPIIEVIRQIPNYKNSFWQYQYKETNVYHFSAFDYFLEKASIEKDTKGILGTELLIKTWYKEPSLSQILKDTLHAFQISNEIASPEIDRQEIGHSNLSRIITFRENRYGYYLPLSTIEN